MPIIRKKKNQEAHNFDYDLFDNEENEDNEKLSFQAKKKRKFSKNLKERLECDNPYDNLNEEDKQKYNYLAGQAKYSQYLSMGCIGIAIATAIYNGQAIMGEDFLNFSYGIVDSLALTVTESMEYLFSNIIETFVRAAVVVLPLEKALSFDNRSDIYRSQANEMLGTHKKTLAEKFISKMATRYVNKKSLKESGAVINPYVDEPEEAPVEITPCEEIESTNIR